MNQAISISEIAMIDLTALLTSAGNLPDGGVAVGPLEDAQQKEGAVSVTYTGPINPQLYAPIIDARMQIRVLHNRLATSEQIAQNVFEAWHEKGRRTVTQVSNGHTYLVHLTNIVAGPSQHFDSQETWEFLIFAQMMVGRDFVS